MTYENLRCYIDRLLSTQPMFEVSAVLLMSEVVLEPSANELQSVIILAAKDFLTRCVGHIFIFSIDRLMFLHISATA